MMRSRQNATVLRGALMGAAALSIAGCAAPSPAQRAQCDALGRLNLPNVQITSAKSVAGGRKFSFKTALVGIPFTQLPASCRVTGVIRPVADSEIGFEAWLPATGWNGRFLGIGNGSLAGSIDTLSLGLALKRNYAVAATDTGHLADSRKGSWALNHPEKAKDYGYRAIHETAVVGKAVVRAFYGRAPSHAYFASASNGGRAALMEAQRYPEDYDGILAGAPAFNVSDTLVGWAWNQQHILRPGAWLSPAKLKTVHAAVLKACDGLDGVVDGLLDDPRQCRFDPQVLGCQGAETKTCLTPPQITALRAIYSGPPQADGPAVAYRGFPPGGESGWAQWIPGKKPGKSLEYEFSREFYRYLVYGNPAWTLDDFDLARDRPGVRKALAPLLDATDPDLSRFIARGGKLILYQGWSDPALQPQAVIDYYQAVQARVGSDQAAKSVRLYMVPGLEHVFGGPGPNGFGQFPPGETPDPAGNISAALEAWVESDALPQAIVATKYDSDIKAVLAPSQAKVLRTRPLCPYPQVARWTGQGSSDRAENFRCQTAAATVAATATEAGL